MLTTKEAAEILGVSSRRVNALIEAGALKAERLGRSWAVDEGSVRQRAAAERLRGRPSARSKAALHRARYTLMNRDREVLAFMYDFRSGEVTELEPLDGIAAKPFGVGRLDKSPNRYDLAEWLRNRAIPSGRPHLPAALRHWSLGTPAELMFASWGLSLTDAYWFRPEGAEASWSAVNYFDNGYDEDFGDALLDEGPVGQPLGGGKHALDCPRIFHAAEPAGGNARAAIAQTPDSTTNGMLGKRWVRQRDGDYLIKGGSGNENREPFNEKLACRLLARLLESEEFVEYEIVERHGRAYSSCKNMVGVGAELIPAQDVLTAFAVTEGRDLHRGYLDALAQLEVPGARRLVDKMIVVDHLMANFDRHTRNFGLIRDAETLDGYRVAPLFDHGCGFYSRATTAELEARPYSWLSHPFREYPSQQLALVEDLAWYDPSALAGFEDDIADVLGENSEIDERFIAAVQKQTAHQIASVNALAAERGIVVAGW